MAKKSGDRLLTEGELKRKFPDSGLASNIFLSADNTLWLPSRILALNYHIGGGIPYGKIKELYGQESTGKSLMAMDFSYVTQQCGGIVLWDDAECSFDPAWAIKNGLDLNRIVVLKDENIIEVVSDWIKYQVLYWRSRLTNNEPILLVGDSIAAWDTQENMDTDDLDAKAEMGNRGKKIYQMLRKRNKFLARYGVCTIFINQLRPKVGATKWEDPDTTPGGNAMKFFASIRVGLYSGKRIKDENKRRIGSVIFIRTKKNKVAPPRDNISAEVYFTDDEGKLGFSKYFGLLPILIENEVVERRKGIYYKGRRICSYRDEDEGPFIQAIMEDDILRRNLIRRSGINTVSKFKEKLEATDGNLYPVKIKNKKDADDDGDTE